MGYRGYRFSPGCAQSVLLTSSFWPWTEPWQRPDIAKVELRLEEGEDHNPICKMRIVYDDDSYYERVVPCMFKITASTDDSPWPIAQWVGPLPGDWECTGLTPELPSDGVYFFSATDGLIWEQASACCSPGGWLGITWCSNLYYTQCGACGPHVPPYENQGWFPSVRLKKECGDPYGQWIYDYWLPDDGGCPAFEQPEDILDWLATFPTFTLWWHCGCPDPAVWPAQQYFKLNPHHIAVVEPVSDPTLLGWRCCERFICPSQYAWPRDPTMDAPASGPCCLAVSFDGIAPAAQTCRYGHSPGITDEEQSAHLNPQGVFYQSTTIESGCETWTCRPHGCVWPFPTKLEIDCSVDGGQSSEDCLVGGSGPNHYAKYWWDCNLTLSGTEYIWTEVGLLPQTVVFSASLEEINPWCIQGIICCFGDSDYLSGNWSPPTTPFDWATLLDEGNPITLAFDAEASSLVEGYSPDFTEATATISFALHGEDRVRTFSECNHEQPDCETALGGIDGWRLTTVDLHGRNRAIVLTPASNQSLVWEHGLSPWRLTVGPYERDGACLLRLKYSCAKGDLNYGFCFPEGYGVCNQDAYFCTLTDDVPLDPAQRYAYLNCGFMPGSPITLEPLDGDAQCEDLPDPVPGSVCEATAWRLIWTPPGGAETTVDIEEDGEDRWNTTVGGCEYTVERLDDGTYGEGNYRLTITVEEDEYTADFTTGAYVLCCYADEIGVTLAGDSATIEAVCPSACDALSWTATIDGAPYTLTYTRGYWHYEERDVDENLLAALDLVRLADSGANTRYFFVRSQRDTPVDPFVNGYFECTDGEDCCEFGTLGPYDLLDSGGGDTGEDVTLEAVCE